MRGREFYMKDAYSFDVDLAAARHSYNRMFIAYLRTFAAMGLHVIPMRADTGPIGGDLSHEFHVVAATGESGVFYHERWEAPRSLAVDADDAAALQAYVDALNADYAATDEKRDPAAEAATGAALKESRGIEVGQIFYFRQPNIRPRWACRCRGPTVRRSCPTWAATASACRRLMGAIIEASHDKDGIVWPEAVAPYRVVLINLRADDAACTAAADALYGRLEGAGVEVLLRRPRRARWGQVRHRRPDRRAVAGRRRTEGRRGGDS